MQATRFSVGIDVSKSKLDLALLHQGKIKNKVFANSQAGFKALLEWLEEHVPGGVSSVHVCMEATGSYHEALALFLCDQSVLVSVVNPFVIKRYTESKLQRNKTDRADARVIAQYCEQERPAAFVPPSQSVRSLQALVLRLQTLDVMANAERNRLDVAHTVVKPSVQTVLDGLVTAIADVRRQISDTIDNDPDLKNRSDLLETIPGLGERTIPQLLACIGAPERFESGKALAAYAGLCPAIKESGSSLRRRGGTTTFGNRFLKRCLYFPAMVAGRYNPAIRPFWQRLMAQGKPGKVVIVACMHKLLCLVYAVLKSGRPFDPALSGA